MRFYQVKRFARFARDEGILNSSLIEAVERAARGLVDADLGGGLIKQRVARKGQGRSGGYRTLIAFRSGETAVFLFGFAKSDRANIDPAELAALRELADRLLSDATALQALLTNGNLVEVTP